jgi:hypothetical protein
MSWSCKLGGNGNLFGCATVLARGLVLGIAAVSCAGTTPQGVLEDASRTIAALNAGYHSLCDGREEEPACVVIREHYNRAAGGLLKLNEQVPE